MSKIKSALGEVVDFEMMQIMADYGANAPVKKSTPTNNQPIVVDLPPAQPSMISDSVEHVTPVIEKVVEASPITIVEPEAVDNVDAKTESKKGNK